MRILIICSLRLLAPTQLLTNNRAFSVFRRVLQKGFCRSAGIPKSGAGIHRFTDGGHRIMSSSTIDNNNNSLDGPSSRILSPWLMLRPSFDDESGGDMVYNFHSLANKQIITIPCRNMSSGDINDLEFVGSSHGWLALYNRRNKDVFLSNPLTRRNIKLPSWEGGRVSRVTISCSPDDDGCRTMSIDGAGRLAFCVPGRSKEWTPISGARSAVYNDVVYSSIHELFFCVTRNTMELHCWNVENPLSPSIDRIILHDELNFKSVGYTWPSDTGNVGKRWCWNWMYLAFAQQSDELLLVVRHINSRMRRDGSYANAVIFSKYRGRDYSLPYKTIDFDVFKVDVSAGGRVRYMDGSLEGLSMFVGINDSHSVSASDFAELEPNTIYFCDDVRLIELSGAYAHNYFGGHDNGVFNYETKSFSSCSCDHCILKSLDYDKIKSIYPPPLWFTPTPTSLV